MKLLVIMQKIDKNDENLGAFYLWLNEFSKHFDKVTAIGISVGFLNLPGNVEVFSLGKEKGAGRMGRLYKYWELFSRHYARSDAVLFEMSPEFVIAASPFLLSLKRTTALWYSHKNIPGLKVKAAERLVDYVFTPSELNFRLPSKKVIHTGHAIDTETFVPNPRPVSHSKSLRLLTVGRIAPVKELETIIQACARLKAIWDRDFVLSVVGAPMMPRDFEYFERVKGLVSDLGLKERVVFYGARPYGELPEIYRDHDIFISMTGTGSFDKTVLEAMSCGLTVITGNSAYGKFISDKYVLERTSPNFLAEKIKTLADEHRPNLSLREIAINHHGLESTIKKISARLSSGV